MPTASPVMRATTKDVKDIIDFDTSIENLSPFIAAANQLVTELCANATPPTGYDDIRLKIIEIWLSAHFIAIRDPRYMSERIGGASADLQSKVGLNLGLTPYGQQVMLLDTAGGIARIDKHVAQGKRGKVGIVWLGTPKCNSQVPVRWLYYSLW